MKRRELNYATSWKAGWNEPAPATSHKGGGYPNRQDFDASLRLKEKKKRRKS